MTEQTIDVVRVVATIPTKPEAAEAVRAGLAELAHATRGEEGCLAYDVFESQAAPGTFVTIEAWRHPADLDTHMASPHMAAAFALLGDLLTGDVTVHPLSPLAGAGLA
jgi:quinol monooxygenase YgiN